MRRSTVLLTAGVALTPIMVSLVALASERLVESPERDSIYIAYPKEGTKVTASSTFVVGAAEPGKTLVINGSPVRKNEQGFFAHVVPLKGGTNALVLSSSDSGLEKTIHVQKPVAPPPVQSQPLTILKETIEPKQDMGMSPGDLVIFKVRATPGGELTVKFSDRAVTLSPAPAVRESRVRKGKAKGRATRSPAPKAVASGVNTGLATAYGKVFQSLPDASDLYVGFYKIEATDRFNTQQFKFTLKKDGRTVQEISQGAVTVLNQPHVVQTAHDETVVRVSPDKARMTPLPQGVRLMVDGWNGTDVRCLYGPGQHVFVKAEDTVYEKGSPGVSGPAPKSTVSAINISRSQYGDAVVIPLNQRLPFHIEQSLNPNRLTIRIFGATADTDFASQQYKPAFEEGIDDNDATGTIARSAQEPGMVDGVSFRQAADDVYEVNIKVRGHRQWGYAASYNGTNLMIHVKNPPTFTRSARQGAPALAGLSICVDPGHGGSQPGSTGCSGVTEAQLNLAISQRLKRILEAEGARVIMTRTNDVDLGLYERCDIARNQGADILLSVHNNSLPDGRDPWKEHGSSSYWYHPQSTELARVLKDSLIADVGFPDIGSRYQNLALTRPSNMLAVLVEVGFMIHPDEYAQLLRPEVQEKIAQSLSGGIKRYLNRVPKTSR
ncbi:MAG: N-acetylmuramoyl-L-alanine amidase [Candidatus Obscuribacterales bacterium]|nr:N-acetylmuramoyl-L-alanine amidase [Candidatus Obscuribacterales bacterium]